MFDLPQLPPQDTPQAPRPGSRGRAAVKALGCRLNSGEAELMAEQLRAAGYTLVDWNAPAELYLLNTCTVTHQADADGRRLLRAAQRCNPAAQVVATGCLAQIAGPALMTEGLAHRVLGNADKAAVVPSLLSGTDAGLERLARTAFAQPAQPALARHTRAHLKVQDGCDFMCAFCIIPRARGRARPRNLGNLLVEARTLAAQGVRELVLTGVNLGTYRDGAATLVDVVDALAAEPGVARVRISSIEPTTVDAALLERMADSTHALVPFLHLPLQSGSDRVLQRMRRRHTAGEWRTFAEQALARVPGLCLGTDLLAGHPGEDDAAFAETLTLLEALPLAYLHVFPYSERPGTAATRQPDPVPPPLRKARAARLRALSAAKRRAWHDAHLGRTLPVLFEAPRHAGRAVGYTPNFLRVEVPVPDAAALRNRILPVRLLESGESRMAGTLVQDPAAPGL